MFDSLPICRVCLKTSLEYIDFDTPFEVDASIKAMDNDLTYLDCFQACTRIEIEFDENCPQSLCSSCGLELKIAYEFIQKAESADKTLRQLSASTKVEKFDDEEMKCFLQPELISLNDNLANEDNRKQRPKLLENQLDDEKTYVCTVCGEQFFSQMVLNIHVNRLHTNNLLEDQSNAVDKVECQICEMALSLDNLNSHMQMHEEESSFQDNDNENQDDEEVVMDEPEDVEFEMLDMTNVSADEEDVRINVNDSQDLNDSQDVNDLQDVNDSQDINDSQDVNDSQDATASEGYEPVDQDEEEMLSQIKNETDTDFHVIAKMITEQEKHLVRKEKHKQCEICKKHVRITSFTAHMNVHNGIRQFPCEYCFQAYFSKRSLQKHVKANHSDILESRCKICNETVEAADMKAHIEERHSHVVKCTQCDHECQESKMKDHMKRKHSESKDYLCNVCSKTFTRISTLKDHLKTHENDGQNETYTCDICGKISPSRQCARIHRKIHDESRRTYPCVDCGKIYLSSSSLGLHRRWHTGKAFKCVQCPKMFVTKPEYKIHLRFHTRDYPYQCEMCDKKFNAKGHLNSHLKMHLGWKIKCKVCGKLFATRPAYSDHVFKHSEMPYKCLHCTKGYPTKSKLRYHLKATHSIDMTMDELKEIYVKQPTVTKREKVEWIKVESNEKDSTISDECSL